MNGKMKKTSLRNTSLKKLKSLLKTEIAVIYLTSDGKAFVNEDTAIEHESTLESERDNERRLNEMVNNIAELVCKILKEKQWGIFFKNEPIQALPVQNNTTLYKVNQVKEEELIDSIEQALYERVKEWENHQGKTDQNPQDNELSSGTNQTLTDTEE